MLKSPRLAMKNLNWFTILIKASEDLNLEDWNLRHYKLKDLDLEG